MAESGSLLNFCTCKNVPQVRILSYPKYLLHMKYILLLFTILFVSGCSALNNGRGLTEKEKEMLLINPHVPLQLNN